MEKSAEILEKVAVLLEKYKKNKTLVPPEELAGKYKVPFEKLKRQLADELSDYLKAYSLQWLTLAEDNEGYFTDFIEMVNQLFIESGMGKRVGRAAFKEIDLEHIKQLAEEVRIMVYEKAWMPYFHKHTVLYIPAETFEDGNPQAPRIYNTLVDKFWDDEGGGWIEDKAAVKPALLIKFQSSKAQEGEKHE